MKKGGSNNYLHYEKLAQEPVAATKVDIEFDTNARSPSSKKGKNLLAQDSAVSVCTVCVWRKN